MAIPLAGNNGSGLTVYPLFPGETSLVSSLTGPVLAADNVHVYWYDRQVKRLVKHNVNTDTRTVIVPPTFDMGGDCGGIRSLDGQYIYWFSDTYTETAPAGYKVYRLTVATDTVEVLMALTLLDGALNPNTPIHWMSATQLISTHGNQKGLFLVDITNGNVTTYARLPGYSNYGNWYCDGTWVYITQARTGTNAPGPVTRWKLSEPEYSEIVAGCYPGQGSTANTAVPAYLQDFSQIKSIAGGDGYLYILDNNKIRRVDLSQGIDQIVHTFSVSPQGCQWMIYLPVQQKLFCGDGTKAELIW